MTFVCCLPLWHCWHDGGAPPPALSNPPEPESRNLACWHTSEGEDIWPTGESPPYSCLYPKYRSSCLSERRRRRRIWPSWLTGRTEPIIYPSILLLQWVLCSCSCACLFFFSLPPFPHPFGPFFLTFLTLFSWGFFYTLFISFGKFWPSYLSRLQQSQEQH